MAEHSIYKDIAQRTDGDIYIGVVGPVRTGKSTFVKRFMEEMLLPNIKDANVRERTKDEMPQSAAGKTVMTTEPKFIPDNAVNINFDDGTQVQAKLIDCVGYVVEGAMGTVENGEARMVRTPWREEPMPFVEAAEMGTQKVIDEHSTIGVLVTTDGSIGEIPRENYVEAERRIVDELKSIGKPFAVVLNSANPSNKETVSLAYELEEKYKAPVALVNCLELDAEDIKHILAMILNEFPMAEMKIKLPSWVSVVANEHRIKTSIKESILTCASDVKKIGDFEKATSVLAENEYVDNVITNEINMGTGTVRITLELKPHLFYEVMSEMAGIEITDECQLMSTLNELASLKSKFERVAEALVEVDEKGYGIVMPDVNELRLEEPEIIKQSGGYGVRLRASAQSIHMIRANIETEINPIVGSEQQSEELIKYVLREFEEDPKRIWESNMFGKSLYELMNEGLHTKLSNIPEESRVKLSETLERIINEGSGGLICIIL